MSVRTLLSRSWWPLLAPVAAVAMFLGLACGSNGEAVPTIVITVSTPQPTAVSTPTVTPTPEATPTPAPSPNVCGVNPDAAPTSVLQVLEPPSGERVSNPFHVRGWGSEIGGEDGSGVIVALVNAAGDPVQDKDVPAEPRAGRIAPGGLKVTDSTAPFATDILVKGLSSPTPFCVWVFIETTSRGFPRQVVQVPVLVGP